MLTAPGTCPSTNSCSPRTSRTTAPSGESSGSSGYGEVGSGGVADEEGVACQDEPRLVRSGPVRDGEAAVLGAVARRVQDADRDRSDLDLAAVLERLEWILRLRGRMDGDGSAV